MNVYIYIRMISIHIYIQYIHMGGCEFPDGTQKQTQKTTQCFTPLTKTTQGWWAKWQIDHALFEDVIFFEFLGAKRTRLPGTNIHFLQDTKKKLNLLTKKQLKCDVIETYETKHMINIWFLDYSNQKKRTFPLIFDKNLWKSVDISWNQT